ncbi:MAG: hypothetical protein ACJARX_001750 [Psychroserpens sp.]|jgi:hypothetical protein
MVISILIICLGCKDTSTAIQLETTKEEKQLLKVNKSKTNILIDGKADNIIFGNQKSVSLRSIRVSEPIY